MYVIVLHSDMIIFLTIFERCGHKIILVLENTRGRRNTCVEAMLWVSVSLLHIHVFVGGGPTQKFNQIKDPCLFFIFYYF